MIEVVRDFVHQFGLITGLLVIIAVSLTVTRRSK